MSSLKIVDKFKNNKVVLFWEHCNSHDIIGMSAKTSYYMLLSVFPLALLLFPVLSRLDIQMFEYIIPSSVITILTKATSSTPPKSELTIISLVLIVWSATSSIWALMKGISIIHNGLIHLKIKQGRFWALVFTILLTIVIIICIALTFLSGILINWLSFHFETLSQSILYIVRILIMMGLIFIAVLLLYIITLGNKTRVCNVSRGAIFASVGWIIATWGFEIYMKMFNKYSLLYGEIGIFLGLALWLYIISIVIFIGAEINSYFYKHKETV